MEDDEEIIETDTQTSREDESMTKLGKNFIDMLSSFLKAVDARLETIRDVGNFVELESKKEGISFRAGSIKIGVHQLTKLGLKSLNTLRRELRDNGRRPTGV